MSMISMSVAIDTAVLKNYMNAKIAQDVLTGVTAVSGRMETVPRDSTENSRQSITRLSITWNRFTGHFSE